MAFLSQLPTDRVEHALPDNKPLLSEAEARAEAERCLYCSDAPCIKACPTSIDIPTFIKKITTGNLRGSARTILVENILGYSCARVCPVEVLCEGSCVYTASQNKPIAIGRLQRFATQHATRDLSAPIFEAKAASGKKVACVGAGPASLAFAAYLAMEGHRAVVLEKRGVPGGLNATGVAPYKLHAEDALREIEWVRSLGVEIRTGVHVGYGTSSLQAPLVAPDEQRLERGRNLTFVTGAQLLDEYDAVFLGVGLGDDRKLGIPGEDGPGVAGATAWIEEMKLAKANRAVRFGRVLVVGGGNTAIDVARECAQLGAEDVAMVYRRGAEDMSGYAHEMNAARKEGVRLVTHAQPVAVKRDANGKVAALRIAQSGTERDLPCDFIAIAIGQSKLRAIAIEFPGVALDARGCVVADATTGATGNPKVFSGGDCVNGGKEVVNAVADGRNAARYLHRTWSRASIE
jgi:glutamate synthase (NADPH/NADH) small chain